MVPTMKARTHTIRPGNRRGAEAEARLRRMLDVARRMFVEHGYHHTSLDAILARSGGSKATLLKYFGNKAGLLAAVLNDVAEHLVKDAVNAARSGAPREALTEFGTAVLMFYVRPDSLVIYRSVIAEGYRHPALARGFYFGAHDKFVAALAARTRELARGRADRQPGSTRRCQPLSQSAAQQSAGTRPPRHRPVPSAMRRSAGRSTRLSRCSCTALPARLRPGDRHDARRGPARNHASRSRCQGTRIDSRS